MRSRFDEQLNILNTEMIEMGALCEEAIALASKALTTGDVTLAENVNVMLRDRTPLSEWVDLLQGSIENNDRQFVLYNYEALYYN